MFSVTVKSSPLSTVAADLDDVKNTLSATLTFMPVCF